MCRIMEEEDKFDLKFERWISGSGSLERKRKHFRQRGRCEKQYISFVSVGEVICYILCIFSHAFFLQ